MQETAQMSKDEITKPGLWSIAVLVTILWTCILTEHLTIRRANLEARRALAGIQALRVRTRIPAAAPRIRSKPAGRLMG
jgi:hypothetical protein